MENGKFLILKINLNEQMVYLELDDFKFKAEPLKKFDDNIKENIYVQLYTEQNNSDNYFYKTINNK